MLPKDNRMIETRRNVLSVLLRVLLPSRTRRRTGGLQQILYTRKLTVQEERSPDDELLESSKHVESE